MTYLLDTHYLIWALVDTHKLSKRIEDIIVDPDNRILVSTISFWEIALKHSLGKLRINNLDPERLPERCQNMNIEVVSLDAKDSSTFHELNIVYHKDPFDRMLIWQAINNNYTLISSDSNVKKYTSEGLKVIW